MPQIPVKIEEAEVLDKKISDMCIDKSALLIQSGGVFANIFPSAMDRSKVYRKKYAIALGTGRLLFTRVAEISLFFDYRDDRAEIQISEKALKNIDGILPEVRTFLWRMVSAGKIE